MSCENCEAYWQHAQFGFANHLALSACLRPYEKWVQRGKCLKQHTSTLQSECHTGILAIIKAVVDQVSMLRVFQVGVIAYYEYMLAAHAKKKRLGSPLPTV